MPITNNGGRPPTGDANAQDADDRDQEHAEGAHDDGDADGEHAAEGADAGEDGQDGEGSGEDGTEGEDGSADGSDADLDGDGGEGDEGSRGGRANNTIRELRRQLQESNRRIDELATRQPNDGGEAERGERARREAILEQMTPEERREFHRDEAVHNTQRMVQGLELRLRDSDDRAVFLVKSQTDERYKRYAPKVEETLATLRKRGSWAPRETILATLIGREILSKGPKAAKVQRREAERRVEQGRGNAPNGRGDQGNRGRRQPTLEERLANVKL